MSAIHSDPRTATYERAGADFIRQIRNGDVVRLIRFIVEPTEDDDGVRTLIIAKGSNLSRFPLIAALEHVDDQAAMTYALEVFDELKRAGRATSSEVATWRRGLFTLVPPPSSPPPL